MLLERYAPFLRFAGRMSTSVAEDTSFEDEWLGRFNSRLPRLRDADIILNDVLDSCRNIYEICCEKEETTLQNKYEEFHVIETVVKELVYVEENGFSVPVPNDDIEYYFYSYHRSKTIRVLPFTEEEFFMNDATYVKSQRKPEDYMKLFNTYPSLSFTLLPRIDARAGAFTSVCKTKYKDKTTEVTIEIKIFDERLYKIDNAYWANFTYTITIIPQRANK